MVKKMKLTRKRIKLNGKNNPFYGERHTTAWKKDERRRKRGKNNPMHGKKHRRSTIQKIRQAALKRFTK